MIYCAAISAFEKQKQSVTALELLVDMQWCSLEPAAMTYNAAISAH